MSNNFTVIPSQLKALKLPAPYPKGRFFVFKQGMMDINSGEDVALRYYLRLETVIDQDQLSEIRSLINGKKYSELLPYLEVGSSALPTFISLGFVVYRVFFLSDGDGYSYVMEDAVARFPFDPTANTNPEEDDYSVKANELFTDVMNRLTTRLRDGIAANATANLRVAQATARVNATMSMAQLSGEISTTNSEIEKFAAAVTQTEKNIEIRLKKLMAAVDLKERDTARKDENDEIPFNNKLCTLDDLYVQYLRTLINEDDAYDMSTKLLDMEVDLYKTFDLSEISEAVADDEDEDEDRDADSDSDSDEDEDSNSDEDSDEDDDEASDSDSDADADENDDEE